MVQFSSYCWRIKCLPLLPFSYCSCSLFGYLRSWDPNNHHWHSKQGQERQNLFFICAPKNGLISCFYVRYSLFTFRRPKKQKTLSLSVWKREKKTEKEKRRKNVFVCSTLLLGNHVRGSIAVCCSLRVAGCPVVSNRSFLADEVRYLIWFLHWSRNE